MRPAGLVLSVAVVAQATGLSGQAVTTTAATIQRANVLSRAGRSAEARAVLQNALRSCAAAAAGRGCRQELNFNLGYLLQAEPAAGAERSASLRQAADHYRAVLDDAPASVAAFSNLALIYAELGAAHADPEVLSRAVHEDSTRAGTYLALLGDYYRARGEPERAVQSYATAARIAHDDPLPKLRLVEAYREIGLGGVRELWRLLPSWEPRFPGAAASGYLAVATVAHDADANLAEQALVRWLDLLGRERRVTAASARQLPSNWRSPAVSGLERYLADPWTPPPAEAWWLRRAERAQALALAGVALGEGMVAAGRPTSAERCWTVALSFAPRGSTSRLELSRELASLYVRRPELDRDGVKLAGLDEEMFQAKGEAIMSGNDELRQQYHTVLGLSYAERGVWTSETPWRNGIFQLENALRVASDRERSGRFAQPLAQLRALLAGGYEARGQAERAGGTYADAAAAYLDVDDTARAREMLERAQPLGAAGEAEGLRSVLRLRERAGSGEACRGGRLDAELADGALSGIHAAPAFLPRLRFRALSDCAAAADGAERQRLGAAAFEVIAGGDVPLVGTADLLRLDLAKDALLARFHAEEEESRLVPTEPDAGPSVRLTLAGETSPVFVALSGRTLLAGRLARELRDTDEGVDIRLVDGRVYVAPGREPARAEDLRRRLQAVPGVEAVIVRQPPG